MMGFQSDQQPKLFYPSINLEQRIPERHILRRIRNQVDFDFIYDEVRDRYGSNGNVSVPPPAILKMMLLLVLYNVRSERELMNTIPLDRLAVVLGRNEGQVLKYQLRIISDHQNLLIQDLIPNNLPAPPWLPV